MGDSITDAGHYISLLETHVRHRGFKLRPELINLGLSSEICSGLSELDHPFPRPDRLDRVLKKVRPALVFVCYGMNGGIYYPFHKDRFEAYKRGITKLIRKVKSAGLKIVLLTPTAFDPAPLKQTGKLLGPGEEKYAWLGIYERYDDVMQSYAKWIMEQTRQVDLVIDLHSPMNQYLTARRKQKPEFTMSQDGVPVNQVDHNVLGNAILSAIGGKSVEVSPRLFALISVSVSCTWHD